MYQLCLYMQVILYVYTVNVVIFAGGNFRENVGKTFHVGIIFTLLLLVIWFFRVGEIFAKKTISGKKRENYNTRKFTRLQ